MTKEIQKAVGNWLARRGHEAIIENLQALHSGIEMDVASVSPSNMLTEVEVKVSYQDFLSDKKKKKWYWYNLREFRYCPNYFYYACPFGLIKKREIPDYSGLLYFHKGKIILIRNPIRLHANPVDERLIKKMLRLHTQRYFMGGSMMTVVNRESKATYIKYLELENKSLIKRIQDLHLKYGYE